MLKSDNPNPIKNKNKNIKPVKMYQITKLPNPPWEIVFFIALNLNALSNLFPFFAMLASYMKYMGYIMTKYNPIIIETSPNVLNILLSVRFAPEL
jgi:hypothetical protein